MGNINVSYSTGKVNAINNSVEDNVLIKIGTVVGEDNFSNAYNCFYLEELVYFSGENIEISNTGEKRNISEMKSQEFLELLNKNNSGIWKFSDNKNNGYPVLFWERWLILLQEIIEKIFCYIL